jgi:Glycosyltransferase family 9 (heptosyltransferase)
MSKLIQSYAQACGLKIDQPFVREDFYPLPFERYITLQTASGQGAKNYDYWNEVMILLHAHLENMGIKTVLIGGKDDPNVPFIHDLRGKTTVNQSAYILRHALLHMGNDSFAVHLAGAYGIPLVGIYGSTQSQVHGPYWNNPEKTILIDSHRLGNKPSFVSAEAIKMINFITPETVAESVLKLLGLAVDLNRQSLYFGPLYNNTIFEFVPDALPPAGFYPDQPLTVRMDYHFDEKNLTQIVSQRKVHIITKQPIDINMLRAQRHNILGFNFEIPLETDTEYVANLKRLGVKLVLFTKETDEKKVADLRLKFLDVSLLEKIVDMTKDTFLDGAAQYLNEPKEKLDMILKFDKMHYKSNKYLFSNGKVYLSKADWVADKAVDANGEHVGVVIDSPDFWKEIVHFYVWQEKQ